MFDRRAMVGLEELQVNNNNKEETVVTKQLREWMAPDGRVWRWKGAWEDQHWLLMSAAYYADLPAEVLAAYDALAARLATVKKKNGMKCVQLSTDVALRCFLKN